MYFIMNTDIAPVFSDALAHVISTVSGIHLSCASRGRDPDFCDVTSIMNLRSKMGAILFVSANEPDIRFICSSMIGLPIHEVTMDDVHDTICELTNMAAGNTKLRLSDTDFLFSLTQPFVITGSDMTVIAKKKTRIFSEVLSNESISVKLMIVY
jgi:CheY-specific phosphatase CheX